MGSQTNDKRAPDINTGYPGYAYNFDPITQTCDVQLAIENLFIGMAAAYTLIPKQRLQRVPVQFIQGGGWSLTHPVPDGTPVYVHFAQRGISHWLAENKAEAGLVNGKPAPQFSQLFSYNSAVCTIGNQPIPAAIKGFNNSVTELRNADRSQRITFNKDGLIEIVDGDTYIHVKNGEIYALAKKTTIKSEAIVLDGDTTITKSLTVQGGASISGGSGQTFKVTGDVVQEGNFTLNGVQVNNHSHLEQGDGQNVGPMIKG